MAAEKALTEAQEMDVYLRTKNGESQDDLASEYGVSISTIARAQSAVSKRAVTLNLPTPPPLNDLRDHVRLIRETIETATKNEWMAAERMAECLSAGKPVEPGLLDMLKASRMMVENAKIRLSSLEKLHGAREVIEANKPVYIYTPEEEARLREERKRLFPFSVLD